MNTLRTQIYNDHTIALALHEASTKKVVIFCHGFRGTSTGPARFFVKAARELEKEGISSVRFDQYGSGNSDGEFEESRFDDWVATTIAIARDYLSNGYEVALFGQSMGAATVINADTDEDAAHIAVELIRDGNDVEVRDHETGEDLTGVTLSQIIFEREKKDSGYLPSVLLTNLIRTGGGTLEYVKRSFTASINAVRSLEAEVDQRLESLVRRGELAEDEARRLREEFGRDRLSGLLDLHILDSRLEAALHRLNMPSRVDMLNLQLQLEQLTETLDAALISPPASLPEEDLDGEDALQ